MGDPWRTRIPSRLSVPPSKFSNLRTNRRLPGHLEEKVAGNSKDSEISTALRRRPFFLILNRIGVCFVLIAAALQLRLATAAKASPHAILYNLSAAYSSDLT